MSSIAGFHLAPEDIDYVGQNLSRPECVIAERDGTIWVSDNRGGITRITPAGEQTLVGRIDGDPNGIAMERSGNFLIANIGDGTLYRLRPDESHEVVLDTLEGRRLGAVNFVMIDPQDRIWVTVSTRTEPRSRAIAEPCPDGYVIVLDGHRPRIAASGFHFTNEIRFDAAGAYAYVAETALGRVTRLRVESDLSLAAPETYGPARLFDGALIDGITFDAAGNLWVTEITRNGLWAIAPDRSAHLVFEDPAGKALLFPTSITFGGPDLRTAYVGSLKADRIARFRAPFPGERLSHW
jgi:sugar lactone lactonase YvrE